ncbi:MAG: filamentous hemagglutinin N-terminal domain-containing protein, partial [Symploca sp. SIO1C4]|nr:filamentous hemagglutinin N-terminal domain-containing protein [Symploca sp. SIO1C4]
MKLNISKVGCLLPLILLAFASPKVEAGEVTAESGANGTNTQVNSNGNQFDISGGEVFGNNLFHSFEKFGLDANQIANFLSNPDIQNILGRVVGGDVSVIDGLIRVSGGNPNLFLMNPAGIVFGANARLDVPGSFTATTATGIGFDDNFFNAIGSNNYTELVGNPNNFAFATSEPGSIFNAGDLAVNNGQNLTLLGGSVISTGSISAPGGQITIAAIAGENRVRISQQGQVLSLELETLGNGETASLTNPLSFNPVSLPQMLTDVEVGDATGVTVNEDGSISLSGSGISFDADTGTIVASGSLDVADTASGGSGGTVAVLGDKVALVGAEIEASGDSGGGIVLVGGDYQGEGKVPNADVTYVSSDSEIAADGLVHGDGGSVIIWADQVTQFYGKISARGGSEAGNGGLVEVSGKENLIFDGVVDVSASNGSFGTLLLDPTNIIISDEDSTTGVDDALPDIFEDELDGEITINADTLESQTGNVVLEATNDITIAEGVSLNFVAGESITFTADEDENGFGSFSMDPTQSITTNGRNLSISGEDITAGDINTDKTSVLELGGGFVMLSANGNIETGAIKTGGNPFANSSGGFVDLSADGNIEVKSIDTSNDVTIEPDEFYGGDVTIKAGGFFRAKGAFTSTGVFNNDEFDEFSSDGDVDIEGQEVFGGEILTSILATGLDGGGSITIEHGGSSFRIGPIFEKDADGNLVDDPTHPSTIVTLEDVDSDASFTAGAITSNQENEELISSFRDASLLDTNPVSVNEGQVTITSTFNSNTNTNTDTNLNTDTNFNTDTNPNPNTNTNTNTDTNLNTDTNPNPNTNTNTNTDTNPNTNTDTNPNPNTDTNLNTDTNPNTNTDTNL